MELIPWALREIYSMIKYHEIIQYERCDIFLRNEQVKEQLVMLSPVLAWRRVRISTFLHCRQGTLSLLAEKGWHPSGHPMLSRESSVRNLVNVADWLSYREELPSRVLGGKPWCHLFIIQGL